MLEAKNSELEDMLRVLEDKLKVFSVRFHHENEKDNLEGHKIAKPLMQLERIIPELDMNIASVGKATVEGLKISCNTDIG